VDYFLQKITFYRWVAFATVILNSTKTISFPLTERNCKIATGC